MASDKLSDGLIVQLEDYLKDYPDSRLIVIDTLQKIRTASKDNAYASDYGDISLIKDFADRHSLAVIVVHHIRKQNDSDVFNKVSGTTGLTGSADATFVLEKENRASDTARLYGDGAGTRPIRSLSCVSVIAVGNWWRGKRRRNLQRKRYPMSFFGWWSSCRTKKNGEGQRQNF